MKKINELYLAPLEGITGAIVRNAFFDHFGGIDKYFTPFIPAMKKLNFKYKDDLDPQNNKNVILVPQLISNNAADVLEMAHIIRESYGYLEFNLNLGCPSGTVVSKGRGAGALADLDSLDRMLYEIYEKADFTLTIKSRIGISSLEEWPQILEVYGRYDIPELIIHPRLKEDMYRGSARLDQFALVYQEKINSNSSDKAGKMKLCYNGDIVGKKSYETICESFPETDAIMIGRGMLMYPGLARAIKNDDYKIHENYREELIGFHDDILSAYVDRFSGQKDATLHIKEIWSYLENSFIGIDRELKKLRKSKTTEEYKIYAYEILKNGEIKETFD